MVVAAEEEIGVFKGTAVAGNLSVRRRRRRHRVLYT